MQLALIATRPFQDRSKPTIYQYVTKSRQAVPGRRKSLHLVSKQALKASSVALLGFFGSKMTIVRTPDKTRMQAQGSRRARR